MLTDDQIARNLQKAWEQSQRFSLGKADVQQAAARLARALDDLSIPYAIAGGLAVAAHGHARLTVDVDVVLTAAGLERFKKEWIGRGWVERSHGSRGLRDAELDIDVAILVTGEFPGDGKPKPVAFPDPSAAGKNVEGTRILTLASLIELKLASGMSAPHRLQDLADVIALVRANDLAVDFAEKISPWVGEKFRELWGHAQVRDG